MLLKKNLVTHMFLINKVLDRGCNDDINGILRKQTTEDIMGIINFYKPLKPTIESNIKICHIKYPHTTASIRPEHLNQVVKVVLIEGIGKEASKFGEGFLISSGNNVIKVWDLDEMADVKKLQPKFVSEPIENHYLKGTIGADSKKENYDNVVDMIVSNAQRTKPGLDRYLFSFHRNQMLQVRSVNNILKGDFTILDQITNVHFYANSKNADSIKNKSYNHSVRTVKTVPCAINKKNTRLFFITKYRSLKVFDIYKIDSIKSLDIKAGTLTKKLTNYTKILLIDKDKYLIINCLNTVKIYKVANLSEFDADNPYFVYCNMHHSEVRAVVVDDTRKLLITGAYDGDIKLWGIRNLSRLENVPLKHMMAVHNCAINDIILDSKCIFMITCSNDKSCKFYNLNELILDNNFFECQKETGDSEGVTFAKPTYMKDLINNVGIARNLTYIPMYHCVNLNEYAIKSLVVTNHSMFFSMSFDGDIKISNISEFYNGAFHKTGESFYCEPTEKILDIYSGLECDDPCF